MTQASPVAPFKVGDRVIKNPETWVVNAFDDWGREIGIGVVVEPPFYLEPELVDVRWPHGRCFEAIVGLLPAPPIAARVAGKFVSRGVQQSRSVEPVPPQEPKGLDILIGRGPSLEAIVEVIMDLAGIPFSAIKTPDNSDAVALTIIGLPIWVVMHRYADGDFGHKIAFDAMTATDFHSIARQLSARLGVCVVWPDESTLSATASICHRRDGSEESISIDDSAVDGFIIVPAAIGRGSSA